MRADPWAIGWSALASVMTAIAVAIALFVAIRDTRHLLHLRGVEAEDRRRQQALGVSAWATPESDYPDTPRQNIEGNPWFARVHVLNGSASSISEARVEIGHRHLDGGWESLQESHEWVIVPPGAQFHADFRQGYVRNFSSPPHNVLLCEVSFRDSNGVRWRRDAFNELTEIG